MAVLSLGVTCRFLVSAEGAGLPVTVVLNKADLVPAEQCQAAISEASRLP